MTHQHDQWHDLGANKRLYQIQPKNYYVLVTLIQQKLLISLSQTSISLRIIFKDFQKTWHEQRNNGQDWNVALYVNFQFLPILHTQNPAVWGAFVRRGAEMDSSPQALQILKPNKTSCMSQKNDVRLPAIAWCILIPKKCPHKTHSNTQGLQDRKRDQ